DFGQVQSDTQVLNLSPFEVQFNENRPCCMEGTEHFNKGSLFYSRRVGGRPIYYFNVENQLDSGEVIISNPIDSRLLNATKVSGRTQSGLGVGVFNAVSAEMNAVVKDPEGNKREILTQPLSNYNILVLDQSLRNNSFISLINTNVMRQGSTYDANLTGTVFRFTDKKNKYALNGKAALSQRYFSDNTDLGYTYRLSGGKISGNFQWTLTHDVKSDTYNPNDLGILFVNNEMLEDVNVRYNIYKPFWKVNNLYTSAGVTYSRRYEPGAFQNFVIYSNINTTFKNFTSVGTWFNSEPVKTYDFFEPRVSGRYYHFPTNHQAGIWISTDYRKKFALDLEGNYRIFDENDRKTITYTISPRYRVNNQLSFIYNFNNSRRLDDMGFARLLEADTVIFGRRNVKTYTNTLSGSYVFNNRMSLTLRTRHYWSQAVYNDFYLLRQNGTLTLFPQIENRNNVNFNAFNIDMVYSWWFAPGSEISIVWKNAILKEERELAPAYYNDDTYFRNFSNILSAPQNNSISVKVLYYLDYNQIKRKIT
ncbi:MAG: DUF5916 domain-containing protein, partial [Hymenobacteraceae bacterium]|nr:DUF5916 domain-containing protein [Hymenobacteraceae bacterium]